MGDQLTGMDGTDGVLSVHENRLDAMHGFFYSDFDSIKDICCEADYCIVHYMISGCTDEFVWIIFNIFSMATGDNRTGLLNRSHGVEKKTVDVGDEF